MAALYAVADRTASLTVAGRLAELRTTSTDRAHVKSVEFAVAVAGASPTVGLIRPGAIGVTPTAPKTVQPLEPAAAPGTVTHAVAWGTAPTLPGTPVYLRRIALPATIGAGWVWNFAEGELIVPVSSSILFDLIALSAATATALDVNWTLYE